MARLGACIRRPVLRRIVVAEGGVVALALYLLFLLGIFFFGVFFFTALLGRVWCGWACPQTVFLESIIRPIERLIEERRENGRFRPRDRRVLGWR